MRHFGTLLQVAAALFLWLALALQASRASAQRLEPVRFDDERSFFVLPTGNGYGFQIFDSSRGWLLAYLDHPYRYLRPASDEMKDGIERRNLLEGLATDVIFPRTAGDGRSVRLESLSVGDVNYVEESNILRVTHAPGSRGAAVERYFFSPFGVDANAMIALVHLTDRRTATGAIVNASLRFHMGANPVSLVFWQPSLDVIKLPGEKIYRLDGLDRPVWVEEGRGLGSMIYVPLQKQSSGTCDIYGLTAPRPPPPSTDEHGDRACVADDLGMLFSAPVDEQGYFGVMMAYVEDVTQVAAQAQQLVSWINGRSSRSILQDALGEWREWRREPSIQFRNQDESKLWRQSEAVLRMAQVREPNIDQPGSRRTSHGMVLASLAPGHWTTGWVRDGVYATVAMARAGHWPEARDSLNFFLNADPVGKYKNYLGGVDYRISVTRYYGSGEEEADYSGQATPNIETDGWGLVLWASRQYLDHSGDYAWLNSLTRTGTVYQTLLEGVVKPIVSQLETTGDLAGVMKPDSSIWEVHQQNARHFAYTTLATARGLCDFASIAKRSGHAADHAVYSVLAGRVRDAFERVFRAPEGYLVAAVERSRETDLDAAVVEAYGFDVLRDFKSDLAKTTLAHLELLKLPSGGFSRSVGDSTYQTNEWAFIDQRMASAYLRMNQREKADALIDMITGRAIKNFYLLPELYVATPSEGPIGSYQGSNPMVGYGAGAYLMALLDREGKLESRGCD